MVDLESWKNSGVFGQHKHAEQLEDFYQPLEPRTAVYTVYC